MVCRYLAEDLVSHPPERYHLRRRGGGGLFNTPQKTQTFLYLAEVEQPVSECGYAHMLTYLVSQPDVFKDECSMYSFPILQSAELPVVDVDSLDQQEEVAVNTPLPTTAMQNAEMSLNKFLSRPRLPLRLHSHQMVQNRNIRYDHHPHQRLGG